ncbi:MAG: cytochrome P450, partial [Acidimicrobiia bacterium]
MGCPAFDPFAPSYLADPYPVFADLRAEAPVCYEPGLDHFVVSRYADIRAVLADPATYSARNAVSPLVRFSAEVVRLMREGRFTAPHILVNLDPPEHARTRRAAGRAFTPRRLAGLEPVIRDLTERHVDRFPPGGPVDIVAGLAFDLPAQVLFVLLGIPEKDVAHVKAWAEDRLTLIWGRPEPDEQVELARRTVEFWQFCERLVETRQSEPGDDLPSELLRESDEREPLTAIEVATVVYGLLFAGHETTTNLLANSVRHLLARPGVWDRLRTDPALIPTAVDEVLRLDSSVPIWRRVTTRPVELGGVALPAGARLLLLLGSANHDETVFKAPAELDLERANPRDHLAFGFGTHFCLGAALARLEVKTALEVLLERLPGLRLTGGQELEFHPNLSFRGPTHLLVEWVPEEVGSQP